jgi:hypothetical protein
MQPHPGDSRSQRDAGLHCLRQCYLSSTGGSPASVTRPTRPAGTRALLTSGRFDHLGPVSAPNTAPQSGLNRAKIGLWAELAPRKGDEQRAHGGVVVRRDPWKGPGAGAGRSLRVATAAGFPSGAPVAQTEGMTSATCPSWCHNHPDGVTEPTKHFGPHWPPMRGDAGFSADVSVVQREDGQTGVWLSDIHEEYLTTAHARSVARALLAAADWVEHQRAT